MELDARHLDDILPEDISGLDDPDLPNFSLSPAMTLYGKFTDYRLVEEVGEEE